MKDLLDQLERLLSEATPGPWALDEENSSLYDVTLIAEFHKESHLQDAKLVQALRNAAPALIARVRELEAEKDHRETLCQEGGEG